MFTPIPDDWRYAPPESVVVGIGPYSSALASILGTVSIPFDQLRAGPQPNADGGYPRVFELLKRVLLVVSEDMAAADALYAHQAAWEWVKRLSSAGDQHELAFIFILPENVSKGFEEALAVGLSLPAILPGTTGHAVWHRSGTLQELLDLAAAIRPMDLLPLLARRAVDGRQLALERLLGAVKQDNPTAIRDAAKAVLDAFMPAEYHLDLFCRHPSHRHGNLLRGWLHAGATGTVTQDWVDTGKKHLADWLVEKGGQSPI